MVPTFFDSVAEPPNVLYKCCGAARVCGTADGEREERIGNTEVGGDGSKFLRDTKK